jgi:hypothetical protein
VDVDSVVDVSGHMAPPFAWSKGEGLVNVHIYVSNVSEESAECVFCIYNGD